MSQENTSLFSVQELDTEMTRVTLKEVYAALRKEDTIQSIKLLDI